MTYLQTNRHTAREYRVLSPGGAWTVALIVSLAGCGGASPAGGAASPEASAEPAPAEATAAEQTGEGAGQAAAASCVVVEQEDGTRLLYSDANDWWFYVEGEAEIDCSSRPGVAMANSGGLVATMTAMAAEEGKDYQTALNEFLAGYRDGVSKSLSLEKPLEYVEKKLGEKQRPANCADVPLVLKGQRSRFLLCVTSAKNGNGDFLVHVVQWMVEEQDYLENQKLAWEAIGARATSWYLQSDTDDDGNLVREW
jgi:hypothetical protein